jgi:hypothetical protein
MCQPVGWHIGRVVVVVGGTDAHPLPLTPCSEGSRLRRVVKIHPNQEREPRFVNTTFCSNLEIERNWGGAQLCPEGPQSFTRTKQESHVLLTDQIPKARISDQVPKTRFQIKFPKPDFGVNSQSKISDQIPKSDFSSNSKSSISDQIPKARFQIKFQKQDFRINFPKAIFQIKFPNQILNRIPQSAFVYQLPKARFQI